MRMASLPVFAYIMLTKMCGMYNIYIYIYTSNYDYIPYVYNIIYIYIHCLVISIAFWLSPFGTILICIIILAASCGGMEKDLWDPVSKVSNLTVNYIWGFP